jgi:hypothetical protein
MTLDRAQLNPEQQAAYDRQMAHYRDVEAEDRERIAALKGVTAKGVQRPGKMNQTETAYARHLDQWRQFHKVLWWIFEPGGLRLADRTFYHPDFAVMMADRTLEMHDTKAPWKGDLKPHWEDDARVKIKVAADRFPLRFVGVHWDKSKMAWVEEQF